MRGVCRKYFLPGCLMFGAVAALAWRLYCWRFDPVISRDGVLYISLIAAVRDGGIVSSGYGAGDLPPLLYVASAAKLAALGMSVEAAAIGLNLICGALLPLLMFLICEQLWHDRKVSFAALAMGIFYPPFVRWSYMIQRESLYLFLVAAAMLLALWSCRKRAYAGFFACGVVAALAVWTRYEGVELIVLLVGGALLKALFDRDSRRMMLRGNLLGVAGLVFGYLLTAWFVHQPLMYIFMKVRYRL